MVQSGISLREEDPTNVERFIGRLTGQKVPFVTPNLRQGPATAPTPSQAGAAAAGAPARATAAAVTTTPQQPQVARPAGQPAAAAANPQLDELTQIERSLTAPGFASADERKQAGVLQIIRQLKQERRALNPDTLAQLRRLAGEASVPAVPMQPSVGAEFGGTGISPGGTPVMGLPQATTPAPPTVEEQIRALITVR
jgi:hypothetical protein